MNAKVNAYIRLARLEKPVGIWLLFWPCAWSITLASESMDWLTLALFFIGSVSMRAAGCVVNDMADRQFDKQVERTKSRPLASGALSMREAFSFLLVLLLISLGVVSQLPLMVFWLACASLPLVFAYPFMKRITWWPQAFLGLTFNFGALMGWAAITESLPLEAWLLYVAGFFWTLGYDTIYGHQDKADDAMIGVKSTSLRLGKHTIPFVACCYVLCVALLGFTSGAWLGLTAVALHFLWQLRTTDIDVPPTCLRAFKSNQWVGALIWLVFFATTQNFLPAF